MGTEFIDRVFATQTPEGQQEIYDEWSATYEAEVFANGYRTPAVIAAAFARYVTPGAGPILDAGCGGGLVCEPLALLGYGPLTGLDISKGMLSVAKAKGIYQQLLNRPLDGDLPFDDGVFDAIISAGVLSPGQAPPEAIGELARVTRKGGYCVFSLRGGNRTTNAYGDLCDALTRQGIWQPVHSTGNFQVMPIAEPDGWHEVRVYRLC